MKSEVLFLYRILFFLFVILLYAIPLHAQSSESWTAYKVIDGVQILTQKEACNDSVNGTYYEYIMFRFINTTATKKQLSWSEKLFYDGKDYSAGGGGDQPVKKIILNPNESLQGGCGNDPEKQYRIFSRFLNYTDKPSLTKYELMNITVTDK